MSVNGRKVITDEVMWSYPHVFSPHKPPKGKPLYSVNLIFEEFGNTHREITEALRYAYSSINWSGYTKKKYEDLYLPIRIGNSSKPNDAMYKDKLYVEATSFEPPEVLNKNGDRMTEENSDEVTGGCFGYVSIAMVPYIKDGEYVGITCRLDNLMKTKDGIIGNFKKPIDRCSAQEDFSKLIKAARF